MAKSKIKYHDHYICREYQKHGKIPGLYSTHIGTFDTEKEAKKCIKIAQKKSGLGDKAYMIIFYQVPYGKKEIQEEELIVL